MYEMSHIFCKSFTLLKIYKKCEFFYAADTI